MFSVRRGIHVCVCVSRCLKVNVHFVEKKACVCVKIAKVNAASAKWCCNKTCSRLL